MGVFCAEYGNPLSFYGNIQLGRFAFPILVYGAWPNEPEIELAEVDEDIIPIAEIPQENIAEKIRLIKRLKTELAATEDTNKRQAIRLLLEAARKEKERQFKLQARIDEEETLFIVLN